MSQPQLEECNVLSTVLSVALSYGLFWFVLVRDLRVFILLLELCTEMRNSIVFERNYILGVNFTVPLFCGSEACFDPDLPSLGFVYVLLYALISVSYWPDIFLIFVPHYHSMSDYKSQYMIRTLFLVSNTKKYCIIPNFSGKIQLRYIHIKIKVQLILNEHPSARHLAVSSTLDEVK
jgi:hypothetical protein